MAKLWKKEPQILLLPNIPKPLHQVAPRNVLGDRWWDKERKLAYASTNYHCKACGVAKNRAAFHNWLEGHEVYEINYENGTSTYLRTVPLCHYCHNYIHDGRLRILLEKGEIHHKKFVDIIHHGDSVLEKHGIIPRKEYLEKTNPTKFAPWETWRLVIGDKQYPPKFKTFEDWCNNFVGKSLPYRIIDLVDGE